MNNPDPNNPQPGDTFINPQGVTWEIRAIDGDAAWVINHANASRCTTSLNNIATWTPVAPTPPDRWARFTPSGGFITTHSTPEQALRDASINGGTAWRYAAVERVTP